jgi:hypothetical protein
MTIVFDRKGSSKQQSPPPVEQQRHQPSFTSASADTQDGFQPSVDERAPLLLPPPAYSAPASRDVERGSHDKRTSLWTRRNKLIAVGALAMLVLAFLIGLLIWPDDSQSDGDWSTDADWVRPSEGLSNKSLLRWTDGNMLARRIQLQPRAGPPPSSLSRTPVLTAGTQRMKASAGPTASRCIPGRLPRVFLSAPAITSQTLSSFMPRGPMLPDRSQSCLTLVFRPASSTLLWKSSTAARSGSRRPSGSGKSRPRQEQELRSWYVHCWARFPSLSADLVSFSLKTAPRHQGWHWKPEDYLFFDVTIHVPAGLTHYDEFEGHATNFGLHLGALQLSHSFERFIWLSHNSAIKVDSLSAKNISLATTNAGFHVQGGIEADTLNVCTTNGGMQFEAASRINVKDTARLRTTNGHIVGSEAADGFVVGRQLFLETSNCESGGVYAFPSLLSLMTY